MRLVMTMVVHDEEELLAANLDYHFAQGVDFALVTDHESTDATAEILAGYTRRGLVEAFREEGPALEQGAWTTRMARRAATEHGADWVINNDADEFWWPLAGDLKDMLGAIPARYGQLAVARHNFLPRPGDEPFWERMVVREARSRNLVGDELEPNAVHRGHPEVEVEGGNHWVSAPGGLDPAPRVPLVEVLHFPVRGYEQFERKVVAHALAYLALPDRDPDVGRDQIALYEMQQRGELRDHFAQMVGGRDADARLASGELVVDTRLRDFLASGARNASEPQRLAVQRFAAAAFEAAGRAEAAEREAADARAGLERRGRELEEAVTALELLRNSRLFRSTRGLRGRYYALRGRGN
jgi:hypothetical protein